MSEISRDAIFSEKKGPCGMLNNESRAFTIYLEVRSTQASSISHTIYLEVRSTQTSSTSHLIKKDTQYAAKTQIIKIYLLIDWGSILNIVTNNVQSTLTFRIMASFVA